MISSTALCRRTALLTLLALAACNRDLGAASAGGTGGCGKDTDCKGNRLCVSGGCIEAPGAAPMPTKRVLEQRARNWTGTYGYDVPGPVEFTLTISGDDTCVYEGTGIQTFFKVACRGNLSGDQYEVYFASTLEGAFHPEEWMDKNRPIMTLYYKGNTLYTDEGQLNKETRGGQLLFRKTR